MKYFLLLAMLVVPHTVVYGYTLVAHESLVPYEVLTLSTEPGQQHIVAGTLNDYPQMIEMTSDEAFFLDVAIRGIPGTSTPDFSGIVIRVLEPRGVAEVARLRASEASWETVTDPLSALPYLAGPSFSGEVASGTYRIEVSTPVNTGQYLLVVGSSNDASTYGQKWDSVSRLYEFYGQSKIGMIRSPLVYYPLGIVLLLIGFGYTIYRTRARLSFRQNHA
jgi:hypothetical protein